MEHAPQHSAQRPPLIEGSRVFSGSHFEVGNNQDAPSINMTDHNIVSGWADDQDKESRQRHELESLEKRRRGDHSSSSNRMHPQEHDAAAHHTAHHNQHHPVPDRPSVRRNGSRQPSPKKDPYAAAGPRTSVEEQLAALQSLNAKKRSSAQPYPSASRGSSSLYPQRTQAAPVIHTPIAQNRQASVQPPPPTSYSSDRRDSNVVPEVVRPPPAAAPKQDIPEASPVPHSPELVMRGPIAQRVDPQPQQVTPTPQPLHDLPRSSLGRQPQEDAHRKLADQRGSSRRDSGESQPTAAAKEPSMSSKPATRQKYFFQADEDASAPTQPQHQQSQQPAEAAPTASGPKKSDYSLL